MPLAIALCFGTMLLPQPLQAEFTVHEWGTLTVLLGSDGAPIRWYQSLEDQHALPSFVHRGMFNKGLKAIDGVTTRMETPVLYFYPSSEMNVSVTASLPSGELSEWFPNALTPIPFKLANPSSLQWVGHLIPPASPLAQQIPHTDDLPGKDYAAARAVPEAWLFHSATPLPDSIAADAPSQIDRLIFYRGSGDLGLPVTSIQTDDDSITVSNIGSSAIPAAVVIQTSAKGISWIRLDTLPPPTGNAQVPKPTTSFVFPNPVSREAAIPALRQTMIELLTSQGLTQAEASAMVATWQDRWFSETGTRVLALLPEAWVNINVPLAITPTPSRLARVYVGRLEILTRARENELLSALTEPTAPKEAAKRLQALDLGRFAQGALKHVKDIQARRTDERYYEVMSAAAKN